MNDDEITRVKKSGMKAAAASWPMDTPQAAPSAVEQPRWEDALEPPEGIQSDRFGFQPSDLGFAEQGVREYTAMKLSERFRPILPVATGGMGKIFLVQEVLSGRYVALKVLVEHALKEEDLVQQFVREAVITARLQHPHIIPVYELGFLMGDQLYYTMRYIDGHPFSELTEKVDLKEQLRILRNAALAVSYAHSEGLWHRDLKPQNILVGPFGDTYVTDWGLVSVQPGCRYEINLPRIVVEQSTYIMPDNLLQSTKKAVTTAIGVILGTPAYMSPEQCSGDDSRMGVASDVWAFGIMLFEAITGHHPIGDLSSLSPLEIRHRMVSARFPDPREFNSNIPTELNNLCLRMLAKMPDRRMQTLKEFVIGISRYLASQGGVPTDARLRAQYMRLAKKNEILIEIAQLSPFSIKRRKELWAKLARF